MSLRGHSGVIVNPSADESAVRSNLTRAMLPPWTALAAAVIAFAISVFFLASPPVSTITVPSGEPDTVTVTGSGEAITYAETVTTNAADFTPFALALAIAIAIATLAVFLYIRVPRILSRRHSEMFADRSVLDGYLVETGGLVEPDAHTLWDASQHEYNARDDDIAIAEYQRAPGLSPRQSDLLARLIVARDASRVAAATILNSED